MVHPSKDIWSVVILWWSLSDDRWGRAQLLQRVTDGATVSNCISTTVELSALPDIMSNEYIYKSTIYIMNECHWDTLVDESVKIFLMCLGT